MLVHSKTETATIIPIMRSVAERVVLFRAVEPMFLRKNYVPLCCIFSEYADGTGVLDASPVTVRGSCLCIPFVRSTNECVFTACCLLLVDALVYAFHRIPHLHIFTGVLSIGRTQGSRSTCFNPSSSCAKSLRFMLNVRCNKCSLVSSAPQCCRHSLHTPYGCLALRRMFDFGSISSRFARVAGQELTCAMALVGKFKFSSVSPRPRVTLPPPPPPFSTSLSVQKPSKLMSLCISRPSRAWRRSFEYCLVPFEKFYFGLMACSCIFEKNTT